MLKDLTNVTAIKKLNNSNLIVRKNLHYTTLIFKSGIIVLIDWRGFMENNNKPVVNLISKPENMLKTVYTACRTCYSADYPINIYNSTDDKEKMLKLIERVISSGHYSTIEHIQVSFAISNVSRACTHQLVRHRHMSFSQKSQRYVKEKGQFDYIIPPTIEKNPELKDKFVEFMNKISKQYQEIVEAGIPAEDARFVLPNAASSSLVASLNLREMIHLANLRLCTRAQYEIRTMVKMMCDELVKEEPWLKPYLVPKCERLGFCDEDKSCGRKPKFDELVSKTGV